MCKTNGLCIFLIKYMALGYESKRITPTALYVEIVEIVEIVKIDAFLFQA